MADDDSSVELRINTDNTDSSFGDDTGGVVLPVTENNQGHIRFRTSVSAKYTPEGRTFTRGHAPTTAAGYGLPAQAFPTAGQVPGFERRETMLRFRNDTRVNEFLTKVTAADESDTKSLSTTNSISKKVGPYVMEFVGTYMFIYSIGCIVSVGHVAMQGLAIGFALSCLVFMGGHISGGHYNPAVTLGIFLSFRGMITLEKMLLYILLQLIGATLGALTAIGVTGQSFTPAVGAGHSIGAAIAAELLATFFLVSVVLNVATTRSQDNNSFFGLAIGMTVFVMATAIGPVSGGAINPAVSFGSFLARGFVTGNFSSTAWIYWVGPPLGSCIAAMVFRLTNFQEYTITTGFTISKIFNWKSKGSDGDMF